MQMISRRLKLNKESLSLLHKTLIKESQKKFQSIRDKRPISRQVKNTIVPDIYNLGYSLVNQLLSKDTEKILRATGERDKLDDIIDIANASDIGELVKTVTLISSRLVTLQVKVTKLEAENASLYKELSNLKSSDKSARDSFGDEISALRSDIERLQRPVKSDSGLPEGFSNQAKVDTCATDDEPNVSDFQYHATIGKTLLKQPKQSQLNRNPKPPSPKRAAPKLTHPLSTDKDKRAPVSAVDKRAPVSVAVERAPVSAATSVARKCVYVGAVSSNNTTEDIKHHIVDIGVKEQDCRIRVLAEKQEYKSFCIDVPGDSYNAVLDRSNWPSGVIIRSFRAPRAAANNHTSTRTTSAQRSCRGDNNWYRRSRHQQQSYNRPNASRREYREEWPELSRTQQYNQRSKGDAPHSYDQYDECYRPNAYERSYRQSRYQVY